jgi:Holliday junction resolvasome RuvABC endonuclease subunit
MKVVLALDIATKTGYSLPKISGTYDMSFAEYDGAKFAAFSAWLANMIDEHNPDIIALESPFMRGAHTRLLFGLAAVAHMMAVFHKKKATERSVQAIKKYATGNGNVKKIEVFQAIKDKGFNPLDDNEADAIALRLLVESEI